MELGWLYQLLEQYPKAADHLAHVVEAMDHPRRFGLNEKARQAILTRGDETTGGETYDMIGECFLLARRLPEAEAAFRQANAAAPDAGVLEYNLARVPPPPASPPRPSPIWRRPLASHLPEGIDPYPLMAEVLKKLGREKEFAPSGWRRSMPAKGPTRPWAASWPGNTPARKNSTRPKRST